MALKTLFIIHLPIDFIRNRSTRTSDKWTPLRAPAREETCPEKPYRMDTLARSDGTGTAPRYIRQGSRADERPSRRLRKSAIVSSHSMRAAAADVCAGI
ncbi:hypothetical protein EVAR_96197_1 [Eumeta japonica]|uniref:Uncharacterized protein n=1 Tax=Eumeta variegata TaxID=151549 RepID=A0A4C1VLG4_EUMVA|nr:hypothetical protein EVAR_96197_1 [Eumeta japonica]